MIENLNLSETFRREHETWVKEYTILNETTHQRLRDEFQVSKSIQNNKVYEYCYLDLIEVISSNVHGTFITVRLSSKKIICHFVECNENVELYDKQIELAVLISLNELGLYGWSVIDKEDLTLNNSNEVYRRYLLKRTV